MSSDCRPIGFFDSGVGGISVLKTAHTLMPNENYIYYGDSANAPYGDKTESQIKDLSLSAGRFLHSKGVKAIVMACNTATSAAGCNLGCVRDERRPDAFSIGHVREDLVRGDFRQRLNYTTRTCFDLVDVFIKVVHVATAGGETECAKRQHRAVTNNEGNIHDYSTPSSR